MVRNWFLIICLCNFAASDLRASCEDLVTLQLMHSSSRAMRTGRYIFGNGHLVWVPRDGGAISSTLPSVARLGYYTNSASHREILRRQLGDARFRAIMSAENPEQAAAAAIVESMPVLDMDSAALMEDNPEDLAVYEEEDILKELIAAVPLSESLSPELLARAFAFLARIGVYAPNLNALIQAQPERFAILARNRARLSALDTPIIIGNVDAWRAGDSSQAVVFRFFGDLQVDKEFSSPSRWARPYHHMGLASIAERIFGEDRVVISQSASAGMSYSQAYRLPDGSNRIVNYEPLYIRLYESSEDPADPSHQAYEVINSRESGVADADPLEVGRWQFSLP